MAFSPPRARVSLQDDDDMDAEGLQMSELEAAQGAAPAGNGYHPLQRDGLRSVSMLFDQGEPHPPDSRKNPYVLFLLSLAKLNE